MADLIHRAGEALYSIVLRAKQIELFSGGTQLPPATPIKRMARLFQLASSNVHAVEKIS